jgi:hypothetical protein
VLELPCIRANDGACNQRAGAALRLAHSCAVATFIPDDGAAARGGRCSVSGLEKPMRDPVSLSYELAAKMPALRARLEQHRADFDELLPHVFMGDVSRYAIEQYHHFARGAGDAADALRLLFSITEVAAREGTEDVKELISVSFLENIAAELADYPAFRAFLGPVLRRELEPILRDFGH